MRHNTRRGVSAALAIAALASLALAGSASAKLVKEFVKFEQCPWTTAEVNKCLHSLTEGGEVTLGKKKTPIVNPVTLQGGFGVPVEGFSKFFAAKNGITLSKTPQPVPGGLAGIVPDASSPALVKALIKFFFENSITGVNSTLELAKPASEIKISEIHLAEEEEVALRMPVKVRLENPFLGKNCYVGSSTTPIWWELTTGFTNPPPPNEQIRGEGGEVSFLESGRILKLTGTELVDNAWGAPKAAGCGGILSFLVSPIINSQLGTITAGNNTARLENTTHIATAAAVKKNDEDNP